MIRRASSPAASAAPSAYRRHFAALLVATALAPAALPLVPDHGWKPGITQAHARENVTIDRIEVATKTGSVVLAGVAVTGSSLGRADIDGLLRSTTVAGLADRLAKFDADRLSIASIEWRHKSGVQDMVTIYEGLEASGIKAGAIGSLVLKTGRQTAKMKTGDKVQNSEATFGRFTMEQVDLAGMFRWYSEADPTGNAPMKQLHGRYELESMDMKMDDASFRFGRMVASGFKARLAKTAPADIMPLLDANMAKPNDQENGLKMLAYFLNVYASFEFGEGSINSIKLAGKDRKTGADFTGGTGKITFGGGAKTGFAINDVEVKAQDGSFRMKKLGFDGDAYALMFLGLEKAFSSLPETGASSGSKAGTSAAEAEIRKIVAEAAAKTTPKDISLKLEGIDGDFPPAKDAKSKDRVKLALTSFETTMGNFVGVTPTRIDYVLNSFRMPVPSDSKDQGIQTLRSLGIDVIDLSARIKGTWDEAKSRFVVDDIMADLGKFARVGLKGELGNIPKPLFENPIQNWPVAMMGANVQNITLALDNRGGIEKLIAKTAGDQKQTPEQFKMQLSAIAPAMIGAYMGGHPDGPALSDAITKFIRTPGSLSITVKSTVPTGITVMDVSAASSNPSVLLNKLKFEAVAK